MGQGRRSWRREGRSRLSSAGQWARRGDWVPLPAISSPFPRVEKDAGRGARQEAPASPPTHFSAKGARWKAGQGGADGRVRCCRQRLTRVSARVSSPRGPRREPPSRNGGWAGQWEAPPESLTHAGGACREKPSAAAPPPAARAAALAAGGGPCAPLLPLQSSGGTRRRLHPPAALPGQSRQRGREEEAAATRAGSPPKPRQREGSPPPVQTAAFPPSVAPARGWDLPVRLGRWLQPRATAEPRSPPLASPSPPAVLERDAKD